MQSMFDWLIGLYATCRNYLIRRIGSNQAVEHAKVLIASIYAVIFCFVFALGQTFHGIVDDLVDSDPLMHKDISEPVRFFLGTETGYRFSALFDRCESGKCKEYSKTTDKGSVTFFSDLSLSEKIWVLINPGGREYIYGKIQKERKQPPLAYRLTSLGSELMNYPVVFEGHVNQKDCDTRIFAADPVEYLKRNKDYSDINECDARYQTNQEDKKSLSDEKTKLEKTKFEKTLEYYALKLYYDAFHWSSVKYADKLDLWQSEIDLLGSIFLCSFIIFITCLVSLLVSAMKKRSITKLLTLKNRSKLLLIIFTFTAGLVSDYGYQMAMRNQVQRAFGFFSSAANRGEIGQQGKENIPEGYEKLQATKWVANSWEYKAVTNQIYMDAAKDVIDYVSRCRSEKPRAVVLDIDETVLSNAAYEMMLRRNGYKHFEAEMMAWDENRAEHPNISRDLVPGSDQFIRAIRGIKNNDIQIVFITNRNEIYADITKNLLKNLGVANISKDGDLFFFKNSTTDKSDRRKSVEITYDVVAYIGDSMGDLSAKLNTDKDPIAGPGMFTEKSRICGVIPTIGNGWYIIPNPIYGDWVKLSEN